MINTSDRPIILKLDGLNVAVRQAIQEVVKFLEVHYGPTPRPSTWQYPVFAFPYFFANFEDASSLVFDERFLQSAFDFVAANSRNEGTRDSLKVLDGYRTGRAAPVRTFAYFRNGLRSLLIQLWKDRVLLLPLRFSAGSHLVGKYPCNELVDFLRTYSGPANRPDNAPALRKQDARRLYSYGPRIVWATNWSCIEEVSIYELADLHRSQLLQHAGNPPDGTFSGEIMPWTLLLAELWTCHPKRVQFSKDDLKRYAEWTLTRQCRGYSFREYSEKHEILRGQKKQQPRTGRRRRDATANRKNDHPRSPDILKGISQDHTHAAVLEYFGKCVGIPRAGFDWMKQVPTYPGREHISLSEISAKWREVFVAYNRFRIDVKGYETTRGSTDAFNLLGDYLFLYVMWWKEIYPDSKVSVPLSPREFTRYVFVSRSVEEPIEAMPKTLLELVRLRRRTPESQYAAIKQLSLFFRFVERRYSEDEEIAGKEFRNPIQDDFDLPRLRKPTKTTKIVFPKGLHAHLIFYGYAVEAFGEYMLELALSDMISMKRGHALRSPFFRTEELGFVPLVFYRGKQYPVLQVPNIFVWSERVIKTSQGDERILFIPHLTSFRILLSAVETGLRLQSIQWLDIRNFDSKNTASDTKSTFSYGPQESYIYPLVVNTDKTRNEPWTTEIVYRVRCLLLREAEFQNNVVQSSAGRAVPYEGRESSRFAPVVPLFRSNSNDNPVSDNAYADHWVEFLVAFQEFYQTVAAGQTVKLVTLAPKRDASGKPTTAKQNGRVYCPLSLRAIHTPHACRATYATNREGILETSEIATQLGHTDVVVTTYYQKPRVEDLHAKLEAADKTLLAEFEIFDRNSTTYVRADKPGSTLVKSFVEDREGTIGQFGFMPAVTIWSSSESDRSDQEGMDLLRNSPMSHLKFRETHICPVGEQCPSDVIARIGAPRRCGLCPLAMKCVDHLPAISAKKNELIERIRYLNAKKEKLQRSGEPSPAADAIWDEMELDTNEFLGWQLSEEILLEIYNKMRPDGNESSEFHTERPDIVRRHLRVAMKQTPQVEFLLKRIAESNAYPSMETPQIQAVAAKIRRRLLSGAGEGYSEYTTDVGDEVTVVAKLLKTVMESRHATLQDIAQQMTDNRLPNQRILSLHLEKK